MDRDQSIQRIRERETPWDIVIVGGGATGVSVALDASSRGYDVLLLEQSDFGKGTSSRSTKLVHGGVRYLRQGNFSLVRDALRERARLRSNAPHLVHDMPFLIPCRSWWNLFFYRVGLAVYDFLASGDDFGRSHCVSKATAIEMMPELARERLRGGVVYHDGQFDDTRLLVSMFRSAQNHDACLANYVAVTGLRKNEDGKVCGIMATDLENDQPLDVPAHAVVNAAGPFCDAVRELDGSSDKLLSASQGVHIVLSRDLFRSDTAMIVPKTSDGRVLFFVPWHNHVIVGTTDTPIPEASLEPKAQKEEVRFLLETASEYLQEPPKPEDVLSVFVGIRPLVKASGSGHTASLSRDHLIDQSKSGLITITGGKWTTVRKMAEDCVDYAIDAAGLASVACKTSDLKLHGFKDNTRDGDPRAFYGSDLDAIEVLEERHPELGELLHEALQIRCSEIVWAVRHEMARTVEDALARRTRALFLNSRVACEVAPRVAELIAKELGRSDDWCRTEVQRFLDTAERYRLT